MHVIVFVFVVPLHCFFNLILRKCHFPSQCKRSRICPVFKSDIACVVNNYRPISIICNFDKVLEIVLHKYLYSDFKVNISPF